MKQSKTVSKKVTKQYGMSEAAQSFFAYKLTPNDVAYAILTGKIEKPRCAVDNKSEWIDKLMTMNSNQIVNRAHASGASKACYLFKDHGFVVKVDYNAGFCGNDYRQGSIEAETWELASTQLKQYLCPVLVCFMGKHKRRTTETLNHEKVVCGQYIIEVMPYAQGVNTASFEECNRLVECIKRVSADSMVKIATWDVRKANVGYIKGRLVVIDYGVL